MKRSYLQQIASLHSWFNKILIAFVQLQRGKKEGGVERELFALCKKNCAAYKISRRFIFITDMLLTATNKVDKKVLRARIESA